MPRAWLPQDQYIEVNTPVPADVAIYGLGERTASAGLAVPRDGLPTVLWARDVASFNADTNLYGSHPFVMLLRKGKLACQAW
jgi:alpha-glucosidase (family GH31 glycosyl hydrolase)